MANPIPAESLARQERERWWRSLAEHGRDPAGEGELPPGAELLAGLDRRRFLQLLGASMALAGCDASPRKRILPYAVAPSDQVPGEAVYYATSMVLDGWATGLLVESHEGRPTKVEGNPAHPASLGAAGVFEQASVLQLYDPSRARALRRRGRPATWLDVEQQLGAPRSDGGDGLRFLLPPTSSPLEGELIARIHRRLPGARFTFGLGAAPPFAGERLAFGRPLQPRWDLSAASVIVALDADFLDGMPFRLRNARDFAARRRAARPSDAVSRLYAVEAMLSVTGSMADHRLRRRSDQVAAVAAAIAAELPGGAALGAEARRLGEADRTWARAAARDLVSAGAEGLVIVGERQAPAAQALGHWMNRAIGSRAAFATAPQLLDAGAATQELPSLLEEIDGGAVDTLVILEGNPSYCAPADLELTRRLRAVAQSLYLGLYADETARDASWFVPAAHYLEAWGDARAYDGTISLQQPLIEPLYGGRTAAEVLAIFAGAAPGGARHLLHEHWARAAGLGEGAWLRALRAGLIEGSAARHEAAALREGAVLAEVARLPAPRTAALEINFLPDPRVHDGQFTNNAWLLELPAPATKLTWDNAALLSPATAARLGLKSERRVALTLADRSVEAPVLVVPGHADDSVTLHLGFGRSGAEALARGVGVDANRVRTSAQPAFAAGLTIEPLAGSFRLAHTQTHFTTHGRPIALATTLERWRAEPDFTAEHKGPLPNLLGPPGGPPRSSHQWAMSIDLSICTGCNACTVACQAENNLLVVGKHAVAESREMHWLRIDTYYRGSPDDPRAVHQPMMCQHCERAPCEYVCPVNATVHSPDGLNEMVYNRCIGTRFCSNNCPYKVRRFNWFDWIERFAANQGEVRLQRNPDVSVRERGVMEKCTYCVQRIREGEIAARLDGRELRTGEIRTACQQTCPTGAIQFDSLANGDSRMVAWRRESRSYAVLHDQGAVPRTQYLARIDNPNPDLDR